MVCKQVNDRNDLIVAVPGYLSINYSHASLSDTARFFGYSSSYFSRFIRDNTGKTFNRIITTFQMERAAALLKTDKSITEIAQEVGCFDASHFTKKFKTVYGLTPNQYRDEK